MPTSTRTGHVRFTMHCGKFTNAPRADRGVRPYNALYVVAEGSCDSAITFCRVDVGIDPYGRIALSPRMRANLPVHPARAGQDLPLRYGETWQHLKSHDPSPHQSASPTAIPTPFAPSGHFPLIGGICPRGEAVGITYPEGRRYQAVPDPRGTPGTRRRRWRCA